MRRFFCHEPEMHWLQMCYDIRYIRPSIIHPAGGRTQPSYGEHAEPRAPGGLAAQRVPE